MPPATGATARRRPATGSASPCRTRCCSGPTAPAFNDFALEFHPVVADNYAPFYSPRSSAPTATRPSCSTACSTTRATSTSKSAALSSTAPPSELACSRSKVATSGLPPSSGNGTRCLPSPLFRPRPTSPRGFPAPTPGGAVAPPGHQADLFWPVRRARSLAPREGLRALAGLGGARPWRSVGRSAPTLASAFCDAAVAAASSRTAPLLGRCGAPGSRRAAAWSVRSTGSPAAARALIVVCPRGPVPARPPRDTDAERLTVVEAVVPRHRARPGRDGRVSRPSASSRTARHRAPRTTAAGTRSARRHARTPSFVPALKPHAFPIGAAAASGRPRPSGRRLPAAAGGCWLWHAG